MLSPALPKARATASLAEVGQGSNLALAQVWRLLRDPLSTVQLQQTRPSMALGHACKATDQVDWVALARPAAQVVARPTAQVVARPAAQVVARPADQVATSFPGHRMCPAPVQMLGLRGA
jgi:hypothetical protein